MSASLCLYKSCAFDHFFRWATFDIRYDDGLLHISVHVNSVRVKHFFTMKTFHPSVIHFVLLHFSIDTRNRSELCVVVLFSVDIMSILFFHPVWSLGQMVPNEKEDDSITLVVYLSIIWFSSCFLIVGGADVFTWLSWCCSYDMEYKKSIRN